MKYSPITVAIIAGGKSSRFGEPKSWAMFRGKRLVEYAVDLGRQLSDDVLIVNGKTLDYSHLGIKTFEDEVAGCGPIGGLYTALLKSNAQKLLVLPVDMPYLNEQVYRALLRHEEGSRPVIACSEKGMEPLVSVWHKQNLALIKHHIDIERYSLRGPIKELDAVFVDLPGHTGNLSQNWFVNINYKEDLEKIKQLVNRG